MDAAQFLKLRVSLDVKRRVQELAHQQLLRESDWLRRAVHAELERAAGERGADVLSRCTDGRSARGQFHLSGRRVEVRLRPDDRLLLQERATARGMASATYASVVVRAHLRALAPIPKEELAALKRSVAELGALGRNLNQIAKVANQTGRTTGPSGHDLRLILKVCEGLRDHVKSLIKANVNSWERGYAETTH